MLARERDALAWSSPAVLAFALFIKPGSGHTQNALVMDQPLPEMRAHICNSLEATRQLASAANSRPARLPEGSFYTVVQLTPTHTETRVPRYDGPALTYAPGGGELVEHVWGGRIHVVPVSIQTVTAQVYYARIRLTNGREMMGWASIPDDPYPLAYARATGARVTP